MKRIPIGNASVGDVVRYEERTAIVTEGPPSPLGVPLQHVVWLDGAYVGGLDTIPSSKLVLTLGRFNRAYYSVAQRQLGMPG